MPLDTEIKAQLGQYLELLESDVVFKASLGEDENSGKVSEFLQEIAGMSEKITFEKATLTRTPSFTITRPETESGITFAGA